MVKGYAAFQSLSMLKNEITKGVGPRVRAFSYEIVLITSAHSFGVYNLFKAINFKLYSLTYCINKKVQVLLYFFFQVSLGKQNQENP